MRKKAIKAIPTEEHNLSTCGPPQAARRRQTLHLQTTHSAPAEDRCAPSPPHTPPFFSLRRRPCFHTFHRARPSNWSLSCRNHWPSKAAAFSPTAVTMTTSLIEKSARPT